jgi:hypothetical protein
MCRAAACMVANARQAQCTLEQREIDVLDLTGRRAVARPRGSVGEHGIGRP